MATAVTPIRSAPDFAAKRTTTGIIMKPDSTATKVSAATILTAERGIESHRLM